ncbi:MAG: LysR family transcriptional regulator, partial [Gammaproteobacteria bacterium]
SSLEGTEKGHLNLAASETASHFITLLLAQFRKIHPGITFNLQIHNRKGLLNCLKSNQVDLVIMGQTPKDMDLISEPFMNNPLVIIGPGEQNSKLSGIKKLSELMEEQFVVREPGSGTRIAMERFFSAHKIQLNTSMEMPNNGAIKQAVSAGLGLGIVSLHTLQQELALDQIQVLNVKEMPIMRIWYIVHQKQKVISPAMEVFKQFVIKQTQPIWTKKYPFLLKHL